MTAADTALGRRGSGGLRLRAGLRALESYQLVALDQVVTPGLDRVKTAGVDIAPDGHVADTEVVGSLWDCQQLLTVHGSEDSARCIHRNTLASYTRPFELCIMRAHILSGGDRSW